MGLNQRDEVFRLIEGQSVVAHETEGLYVWNLVRYESPSSWLDFCFGKCQGDWALKWDKLHYRYVTDRQRALDLHGLA